MSGPTESQAMKRTLHIIIAVLVLLTLTIPVLAADVCPEAGKVESVVDGDLNDIILEAGTEVCIKGSTDLVNVTADGTSTLYQLLGNGHDVSHYSILEATWNTTTTLVTTTSTVPPEPSSTTTITSVTTSTTTTSTTSTSTTLPALTTSAPTGSMEELPTVIIEPLVIVSSTTTTPAAVLPFTGVDDVGPWMLLALALASLGAVLVWTYRGDER